MPRSYNNSRILVFSSPVRNLVLLELYVSLQILKIDVGLEQPIANWAKDGIMAWNSAEEGSPGSPEVIAHYARTIQLLAHIV